MRDMDIFLALDPVEYLFFKYRWRSNKLPFNRARWGVFNLLFFDDPGPEDLVV